MRQRQIQILITHVGLFTLKVFSATDSTGGNSFSCPVLSCDSKVTRFDSETCYQIVGTGPVQYIYGQSCYDPAQIGSSDYVPNVCPMNLLDGSYSWINETLQTQSATNLQGYNQQSQIRYKKVKEYCVSIEAYQQNLNPGRNCSNDYQCKSQLCYQSQCYGLENNLNCNQHSDCDAGYYCRTAINWPYESRCSQQKGQYEICSSDYECQNSLYCWFATSSDRQNNITKCLPLYSQADGQQFGWYQISSTNTSKISFDDYQINGKYCLSGLAYPVNNITARCTSANYISQDGQTLTAPYKCNPLDQTKKCQIYFSIDSSDKTYTSVGTRGYVEVQCKCSLYDKNQSIGFCGSVLGTSYYKNAIAALSNVLSASNCHTLDRSDFRAQKDACGIGTTNDQWRFAVDKMFNVTYWPYVQFSTTYTCINYFFADSWYNLNLDMARLLMISAIGILVLGATMIL